MSNISREIEKQVVSIEMAKKFKYLGVPQESLFCWVLIVQDDMRWEIAFTEEVKKWQSNPEWYSAFTVAELGEILPDAVDIPHRGLGWMDISKVSNEYTVSYRIGCSISDIEHSGDNESDARAKMLIYLIKNKLINL